MSHYDWKFRTSLSPMPYSTSHMAWYITMASPSAKPFSKYKHRKYTIWRLQQWKHNLENTIILHVKRYIYINKCNNTPVSTPGAQQYIKNTAYLENNLRNPVLLERYTKKLSKTQAKIWTFKQLVCFRSSKQSCESHILYALMFSEEPSSVHIHVSTKSPVSWSLWLHWCG